MYLAIVGERCPEIAESRLLAIPEVAEVVRLPADSQLSAPIADHPDSLLCIFEKRLFVHDKYAVVAKDALSRIAKLSGLEIYPVECERGSNYPLDCGFNALTLPDRRMLIGRKKSLAEPLKSLVSADTNQGYAGCTALYAAGTVISADPSIKKAVLTLGVPYYKISGKGISLPGYNEGFIGGAGGAFDNTVCLFGSPKYSESARETEEFCRAHDLTFICLEDAPLTDRGGVKFVEI